MKSGRHNAAFYRAMWRALSRHGEWRGEVWDRRKTGELYQKLLTIRAVADPDGAVRHYVGVFSDITTTRETEARLEHLTHYDPVTGMPNRALLLKLLGRAVVRAELHGHELAVVLLDLDHFKVLNDSLGHAVGDELLLQVAGRLESCLRGDDAVARLAGDEFGLVLNEVGASQLPEVAERLRGALAAPFAIGEQSVFVTASLGVAVAPGDGLDAEDLLAKADAAMYQAKADGRGQVRYFDPAINEHHRQRMELEHDLRTAVAEGHIVLHYQLRVRLPDRAVVGVEGLARWSHPSRGTLPPAEFIPVAEETGLIVDLGRHLLRTACRQLRAWREIGLSHLFVSVNLSARQLLDPCLVADVAACLAEHELPGDRLELELTESLLMDPSEATMATLHGLRQLGVRLSIDDFGTGYSSLSYLKRLPIQTVKVDRSFVTDLPSCRESAALVRAVVSLGRNLDLRVVAEGVESDDQLAFLTGVGCDEAQGYLVAPPLPAAELSALLG
jgi:diguanylate cyclase (GGDEF)-like protein